MEAPMSLFGTSNSISVLRCGFASLKPISVKETMRKWGLKLTTTTWHFEHNEIGLIKNYPSYISVLNEAVMERVKLPPEIDPDLFAETMTRRSVENFEKDTELKSALSKVSSAQKESARPFLEFTRFMRKRYDEKRTLIVQARAGLFQNSNLPFSLCTQFVMSNEIYEGFLDAMQHKINLYESLWLHKTAGNPREFQSKFQEMKESLNPLFDVMERNLFTERCLNILLLASNCKNAVSLDSVEYYDIKKVDNKQFSQLTAEYEDNLNRCVSTIVQMEPSAFSKSPETDLTKVFSQILI
jgi:hypothetical protein